MSVRTRDDVVLLVVKVRTQLQEDGLDYGPLSVLARLRRMGFNQPPSRATLSRIFARSGMVPAEPKKKPRSAYRHARVETISGEPYKPTTHGKNERFHRTSHKY